MVNPFEPPRTTDLEGGGTAQAGTMPDPALRELVASAPWARWTARLTLASLLLSIVSAAVTMSKSSKTVELVGQVVGLVVSLPVTILFLVLFRRYAARATELERGEVRAASDVIDAQRSLFKTFGIVAIVLLALMVVGMIASIAVGVMMGSRR